jgi:hypothetical protein
MSRLDTHPRTYVRGVICQKCHTFVYSRTHHDFRWCPCRSVAVDGGFEYLKVSGVWDGETHRKAVNASRKDLFEDWNTGMDKFGYRACSN